jgi:HAD superfamily hydrolase (TIGR01490 family)
MALNGERARERERMNLALFDFDGTITRGDTFIPFFRFAVGRCRTVCGGLLISPVLVAHQLGLVSTASTRPFMARAGFQGVPADGLRALGRRYARDVLPSGVETRAMERVEWHRRQGDSVVVVSAGLDVYLRPWCEMQGLELICSELEERHGRITGRYRRGDCSGVLKARLIRERFDLARFETVYAYGDTPEDREMLSLAHRKYYRWKEIDDRDAV